MSITSDFSNENELEEDLGFEPLTCDTMPTGRLKDILAKIENSEPSVVNLDACIPATPIGYQVLQTVLYRLKPSCKILSLRFNTFSLESQDLLIEYIAQNDWIETLYLMGTGITPPKLSSLETAWKKHLKARPSENYGFTLIRVFIDPNAPPEEE